MATPNATFATGIAQFIHQASFGVVPLERAAQFGLLCFATFVFDTLDACTRLARYVVMELTGWKGRVGMMAATLVTLSIPCWLLSLEPAQVNGQPVPLWRVFWSLFGSSNQLLAGLALLAATVWVARYGKKFWITLGPAMFMLTMTIWSLVLMIFQYLERSRTATMATVQHVEFTVALLLTSLALWLIVEAILIFRHNGHLAGQPAVASA